MARQIVHEMTPKTALSRTLRLGGGSAQTSDAVNIL